MKSIKLTKRIIVSAILVTVIFATGCSNADKSENSLNEKDVSALGVEFDSENQEHLNMVFEDVFDIWERGENVDADYVQELTGLSKSEAKALLQNIAVAFEELEGYNPLEGHPDTENESNQANSQPSSNPYEKGTLDYAVFEKMKSYEFSDDNFPKQINEVYPSVEYSLKNIKAYLENEILKNYKGAYSALKAKELGLIDPVVYQRIDEYSQLIINDNIDTENKYLLSKYRTEIEETFYEIIINFVLDLRQDVGIDYDSNSYASQLYTLLQDKIMKHISDINIENRIIPDTIVNLYIIDFMKEFIPAFGADYFEELGYIKFKIPKIDLTKDVELTPSQKEMLKNSNYRYTITDNLEEKMKPVVNAIKDGNELFINLSVDKLFINEIIAVEYFELGTEISFLTFDGRSRSYFEHHGVPSELGISGVNDFVVLPKNVVFNGEKMSIRDIGSDRVSTLFNDLFTKIHKAAQITEGVDRPYDGAIPLAYGVSGDYMYSVTTGPGKEIHDIILSKSHIEVTDSSEGIKVEVIVDEYVLFDAFKTNY